MNGCGGSSSTDGSSNTVTPVETNTVTISGSSFVPVSIKVSPGTTVTWINQDSTAHTVVSDTNLFKSGNLDKGQSFKFKFDTKGTFSYKCSIHLTMQGTVFVQEPVSTSPY